MHYWEGITFESPQIPSILGFKGITGYHIGYKESSHIHSTLTSQNFISDYPVDISAGTQMMFIYLDIIYYQIVGDTKAPLLRVIDTKRRVKNGYVCSIEPNHRKIFSNLDYKKLLVNNIQSIAVNLRTEAAKRIGKELLVQAAPELIDIATRKKTPKQALKNTVNNTIKKQVGAGRTKSHMSRKRKTTTTTTTTTRKRKTKALIPKKRTPLRSRSNFFTKVRNDF